MKKLLIVVDMQNDFINGALGTKEAAYIVPAVEKKIKEYEAAGNEVIFTLDTHQENYLETLEGKKLPVKHCIIGTKGWELSPAIDKFHGKRFEKDGFGSLDCTEYASQKGFDQIELVGLCTDICVISNAIMLKTKLPGTPIQVDAQCCAGVTPESHKNALRAMSMCHIDIING